MFMDHFDLSRKVSSSMLSSQRSMSLLKVFVPCVCFYLMFNLRSVEGLAEEVRSLALCVVLAEWECWFLPWAAHFMLRCLSCPSWTLHLFTCTLPPLPVSFTFLPPTYFLKYSEQCLLLWFGLHSHPIFNTCLLIAVTLSAQERFVR